MAQGTPHGLRMAARYVLLVVVPVGVLVAALVLGARLSPRPAAGVLVTLPAHPAGTSSFVLVRLLVQVVLVLAAARLVGRLFRRLGQPQVVGEMAAGLLLGPSLLGRLWPVAYEAIFPAGSLDFLQALSQVGLLVFMFLVGLELDTAVLRSRGRAAVLISHASIAAPFALGTLLALWLYPRVGEPQVGFTGFALFIGIAMSVTAFPVLARILAERRMLSTRVGSLTLACAAVDDVTAWSLLAGVVLLVRAAHTGLPLWITIGGTLLFVLGMLGLVRPFLRRFALDAGREFSHDRLAVVLLVVLSAALTTEQLGIHGLFGAFFAGVVMPRDAAFVRALTGRLEDLVVVLLLPLFFAFTGLRTEVGLLAGPEMWLVCTLVILVAVAGKLGGSALAARLSGMSWREAGMLGALMNTRGLMELVVLNVGLDIGVISPSLFTAMVLMALVTTLMTTPLLALYERKEPKAEPGPMPPP